TKPPNRRNSTPTAPNQARATRGRETGPSDSGNLFDFAPLEPVLPLSTELRLAVASDHADFAIDQVHELDPNWESNLDKIDRNATDEEKILHYEAVKDHAEAKFHELLHWGVGKNSDLNWKNTPPPIDGQRVIALYRKRHKTLDNRGRDRWQTSPNVVAFTM